MKDSLQDGKVQPEADTRIVDLRVLATSDIHAQLLGFDYVSDRPIGHKGLASLATLVAEARAEATANGMGCLLLDNGDLLQGTDLGQHLMQMPADPDHPLIASLAQMGYDTIGIGNHDLDYGLDYLINIAKAAPCPVISSNLILDEDSPLQQYALLQCALPQDVEGAAQTLKIGVVSALPERTSIWNAAQLRNRATIAPAIGSLQRNIAELLQQGADIIIMLAHMGIEDAGPDGSRRDDARDIAGLEHVDAVISGHTHRRLPGADHTGYACVDAARGTLVTRPAAMPGFDASDLAVLDLRLSQDGEGRWRVIEHAAALRQNGGDIDADPAIASRCKPAHTSTRSQLAKPCAFTAIPIHNFFSLVTPTATCALVASAKHRLVEEGIAHLAETDLPLLASAAAHNAGGRAGPDNFLHIPAGDIALRHLSGLCPYANTVCALRVTGRDLRLWLEHAAGVFHQLDPNKQDQPLVDNRRPAFDFDTFYGLDYRMDPTRPVGRRIVGLSHQGIAVDASQRFVLATNSFRAAGGGGGPQFRPEQIIFQSSVSLIDALTTVLKDRALAFPLGSTPWSFACSSPTSAVIRTSPTAIRYLRDIRHLHPVPLGTDDDGFALIRLTL